MNAPDPPSEAPIGPPHEQTPATGAARFPASKSDLAGASATAERIYFPELDGLRFFAFLMVYCFHNGAPGGILPNLVGKPLANVLRENGGYGVQLFFILSGYLITTLLLREESRHGRIALRAFWVRRILRIWPLYYLIVAIGFFVLPALDGSIGSTSHRLLVRDHLPWFLMFLGNWSMALVRPAPDWLSVLWSVCVEEQFYLVVPLLIAFVPMRARRPLVVGLMAASIATRAWCAHRYSSPLMIVFNTFAQFDTLLSGVLLALVLGWDRDRPSLRFWLRWLQWPLYVVIGWVMSHRQLGHGAPWHRTWDFVAVWLCGVGVVLVAVWGGGWIGGWLRAVLSYSRFVWLGKISYGLYMYHEIAFWTRDQLGPRLGWFPNKEEILAVATFALTIGLAAGSYYGYERWFLRWKSAWTRVPSRPV